MDLTDLRKKIDDIDSRLLELLLQRMEISKDVARYKAQHNLPVLNTGREQEVLDRAARSGGEFADSMCLLFSAIMDMSRAAQHSMLMGGDELRKAVRGALNTPAEMNGKSIACAGVLGAYSSQAAKSLFPDGKLLYYKTFEDVFTAVEDGSADFGVVPVENSTAGSVHETYDLIMKYRFYIVHGFDLPVRHCLCAKKGTKIQDIKKMYSHHQAISQCSEFIEKTGAQVVDYSNTAAAARHVSHKDSGDCAAICSKEAAEEYGLEILENDIQTNTGNTTRFLAFSKKLIIEDGADKVSLIFTLPHTTGSLYKLLGRFAAVGLNLTKIESRPANESNFTYHFYLDLSGSVTNEKTLDLLCALSDELPVFNFLGNFKEYRSQ